MPTCADGHVRWEAAGEIITDWGEPETTRSVALGYPVFRRAGSFADVEPWMARVWSSAKQEMSPTTSRQVTRRADSRRAVARRQAELDAGERERKAREVDLAVSFRAGEVKRQALLRAVSDAETRLGDMVDQLIRSGSTYQRCEVLLDVPQDELRRLRALTRHDEPQEGGAREKVEHGRRPSHGDAGSSRGSVAAAGTPVEASPSPESRAPFPGPGDRSG